jgi:TIR domain
MDDERPGGAEQERVTVGRGLGVREIQRAGAPSSKAIADGLNARGRPTARGRRWQQIAACENCSVRQVDPDRGIAAGERWERALNEAASRCEAVLFLVSRDWLASGWCLKEFNLANKLNKRLFGLLIEDLAVADLPVNVTSTWQLVRLCSGTDHVMLRLSMPFTGKEAHVTFSAEALGRLKAGLQRAGLDSRFFAWPPEGDPNRPPYRGLRPLEADDAGIFFGRDAPIVEALDTLRGLRDGAPPRLLVILARRAPANRRSCVRAFFRGSHATTRTSCHFSAGPGY